MEFLSPQPSADVLRTIYSDHYFLSDREGVSKAGVAGLKRKTAQIYLHHLLAATRGEMGRLLEVGCGKGEFLIAAQERGFRVEGLEISEDSVANANKQLGAPVVHLGDIESVPLSSPQFDVVVFCDVIEHVRDPRAFIRSVHHRLRPGGTILLVTPATDSWSYRLMGTRWMEYKIEHLFYFNQRSITSLLLEEDFEQIRVFPNKKALSFAYVLAHFRRFPVPFWSGAVELFGKLLPRRISQQAFPIVASGLALTARKKPQV